MKQEGEEGTIKRNKTHYVDISFPYTEKSMGRFHYLIASCRSVGVFFLSYRMLHFKVLPTNSTRGAEHIAGSGYTSGQASILHLRKIITSPSLPLARLDW